MALAIVMKSHVTVDKHTVGGGRKGLSKEVECRQAKLEIGLLVVVLVSEGEVLNLSVTGTCRNISPANQ
jgi:hypothetical protein